MSKKMSLEEATIQSLYNQLDDSEKKRNVDGIVDDILIVTDPEISSEEYNELIDRANELVDETEEGDIPQLEDYLGMYAQMCPICGSSFIEDHILEPGTACPICLDTPQAFVMIGQLQDEEEVAEREGVQTEENEENSDTGYSGVVDETPDNEIADNNEPEQLAASEEVKTSDNKLQEDVNKVEEVVTSKTVNGWSDKVRKETADFFADVKQADKEIMGGNKGEFTQAKTENELSDYFDIISRSALEISNSLKEEKKLNKKQEYLEYGNFNPLDKDTFLDVDDLRNYIEEMGYDVMNGISEKDTQIEVFDPRESDGNVYVFDMDVTADDVRIYYNPRENYNMNESKEIKTEVEKKINTRTIKLNDEVEVEIEVDETPGFEKSVNKIWYTDYDGSTDFGYNKEEDKFVAFNNPDGSFLTPEEDKAIKDEIHKILKEVKTEAKTARDYFEQEMEKRAEENKAGIKVVAETGHYMLVIAKGEVVNLTVITGDSDTFRRIPEVYIDQDYKGKCISAGVNWGALGTCPPDEALEYSNLIKEAADFCNEIQGKDFSSELEESKKTESKAKGYRRFAK